MPRVAVVLFALLMHGAAAQDGNGNDTGLGLVLLRTWPPTGQARAFDFVESVAPEDTFEVAFGTPSARSLLFYSVPAYRFVEPGVDQRPEGGLYSDNGRVAFFDPSWFSALIVTPHFGTVGFRWIGREGSWVRVVVNEDDGTALWIRLGPHAVAVEWENAFAQSDCAERDIPYSSEGLEVVDALPLRTAPSDQAPVVEEELFGGCLEVLSVEGDWLRVRDGRGSRQGIWWVRWRAGRELFMIPGRQDGYGSFFE